MNRYVAAAIAALSLVVLAAPAQAARTVYQGQWLCDDRGAVMPLGGIELQLWRRGSPDFLPVEWVGGIDDRGFANPDGTFSLRATDPEDNHFVRMALRDGAGVRLKDFWGINDWSVDSGGSPNNVPVRDLGGLLFTTPGQSHKCAIWRGLHLAHRDFRDLMGVNPPSGGLLIQADAPGGGPFTPHTEIWWTPGFPVGYSGPRDDSITRHEFGHVIRHGYDGDAGHFFGDVVAHNYLRNHEPCSKNGFGVAFNEGWAEYWARDYAPAPACPGRGADDYEVEGNVAAALANLEATCFSGNRPALVSILRNNPGVIHSYAEFRALVACPFPLLLAPPPPVQPVSFEISDSRRADIARAQARAIDLRLRGLRADLRTAVRRSARPVACLNDPCNAALRQTMLPAALRTEIALAELVRRTIDDGDTAAEQAAMGKLTVAQTSARMKAVQRGNRIRAAKISADGIRAALTAGGGVFVEDQSRATRRLRSRLVARLASFRKAQRGASAAPGVVLDQAIVDRITKVTPQVFPDPEPAPKPSTPTPIREASTLTVACPANGKPGSYVTVGALSPVRAGVSVELHVTPPGAPETVQTATTDATGAYSTTVAMPTVGTWTIFARWAGDANTLPDDSPTCQTVISP